MSIVSDSATAHGPPASVFSLHRRTRCRTTLQFISAPSRARQGREPKGAMLWIFPVKRRPHVVTAARTNGQVGPWPA